MPETQQQIRSHTFTWEDPAVNATALGRLSGLETLRAMIAGELPPPPVMRLIDADRLEAHEAGSVSVFLQPKEFHYNPLGSVHGGVISTVMDTATGCAVHSTLDAGTGYTTLDLNTRFLRPVTIASGMLRCDGTVVSRGRRTATAQATLMDGRGNLVAHAMSTCLLFPIESPRSGTGSTRTS